jgi:ACR3 family arsenite efflux pump ArsB
VFRILQIIKKRLTISIPITMLLGFLVGQLTDVTFLAAAILPLTILMIYPMMVTLHIRSVITGFDPRLQAGTQLVNLVAIPLVAFGLGRLFLADQPMLAFGLLLVGLLPTSGMTISWTGFAKGNMHAAVRMTVLGLLLGALIIPIYGPLFMGQSVDIPVARTFKQIGLIVFVPMGLGLITRFALMKKYGLEHFNKAIKPKFPLLATVGVLGVIFVAMALKAPALAARPQLVLELLAPILLFYVINYAIASLVARTFYRYEDGIALVYGTVMRNLSVGLAIALTVFGREQGSEMALIIAAAFVVQVQSAAWYLRFARKILKPAEAASAA